MPPALDFNDTEIAFRSRATSELRKAQILFRSFGYPALISAGPKLLNLAYSLHLPVTPLVRATIFDQFCGGVTIDDCDRTVAELSGFNIRSILDYSVEGLGRERDFERTVEETAHAIAKASRSPATPYAVFKVTGLGRLALLEKAASGVTLTAAETDELARVRARMHRLAVAARDGGRRLLIDAEESWIQPVIDRLAEDLMAELNRESVVVYSTLQMYRVDRFAYLKKLHRRGKDEGFRPGIKLVRGAYMEKERARAASLGQPSPIQLDKAATDRDFDAAVVFGVDHLDDLALFVGTHNEASTRRLADLMVERGLARNDPRVEFSQLLGMSDNLTYNLAHHGFNVSKYLPYGPVKAVIPYLVRRAEENSAIKGQAGRELQLIERELRRRAGAH